MIGRGKKMYIELTNQTLTTMLLDCISHFPSVEQRKECFGLVFGEQGENPIGEYTFPVGNVIDKTEDSVTADNQVNAIVQQAHQLAFTSDFVAYYHSHPNHQIYTQIADPSIADVTVAKNINSNIEIIFGIAKIKGNKKGTILQYDYSKDDQYEFLNKAADPEAGIPECVKVGEDGQFIIGRYKDYEFHIRAYYNTGNSLKEVKLYSSEVIVNLLLHEHGINLEMLPKEAMYYLKKLEYSVRLANRKKYENKVLYLIEQIKKTMSN